MVGTSTRGTAMATVLVVEDEPLLRMDAVDFLHEEGFLVIDAGSGDEGLVLLRNRPEVMVLFTDIHMPGSLNGLELARIAASDFKHVRLLIVSGRGVPNVTDLPPGAHFMAKPYEVSAVLAHIHEVMRA